jgi:aminoglycoside 6'-N-acetyltransferase
MGCGGCGSARDGPFDLEFRPLTRSDLAVLADWLAAPHVARWWRESSDLQAVTGAYGPAADGTDTTECFVVLGDGEPVGFAQCYRLADEPSWQASLAPTGVPINAAGVDYLIGRPDLVGQGLGPRLIGAFVDRVWGRYPEVPAVVASVSRDNRRSWRALEKAGFIRVWSGEIRSDDPSDEGPSHVYLRPRPAP